MKRDEKARKKFLKLLKVPHTVEMLSRFLDVSERTVYRWLREEEMKLERVGISRPTLYRVKK
jgi:predicted DNA-binding transcriptional regulator AlpA